MAWIESHQELGRHPKTYQAANLLGVSLPAMIGHLHCLWWWALDFAPNGDLTDWDARHIAAGAKWEGDPEQFVQALIDCGVGGRPGFLETTGGRLRINDWIEYTGRYLKAKRRYDLYSDEDLVRAVRSRDGDVCRYCGSTVNWSDRKGPRGGTYDHVDPDGPNTPENVVVACRGCNSAKGRRTPKAWAGMQPPRRFNPLGSSTPRADDPQAPTDNLQVPDRLSARQDQTGQDLTLPDLTGQDQTGPGNGELAADPESPQEKAQALAALWNEIVPSPKVYRLSGTRLKHALVRVQTYPDLDWWRQVIERIMATPFLRGESKSRWVADFDWLVRNDENPVRVLEGKYEDARAGPQDVQRRYQAMLEGAS